MSWPIIVSGCVYAFIFLYAFNDFMRQAAATEYVSVSSNAGAGRANQYVLPRSSYVPHRDGDILNVGP